MSSNLKNNTTTIQEILEMVNTLPEAGGSGGDTTTVEQATPTISVSSSGLITASVTQEAGQVAAGTKSATMQLTTQAAKTYTPGDSEQTIAPGTYLIGYQTISAVPTQTKTATANGTVTPDAGKYLSSVTVSIPTYDGTVA